MKVADTILAVLSDMHTGGTTALFPAEGFVGEDEESNLIKPNKKQMEIHPVFVRFAGEVAVARKGKRLLLVNLGDAIDGFHHGSMQESLFRVDDQCEAHQMLMRDFMKRTGFDSGKGDSLYYVRGTESHVGEKENQLAKEMRAVRSATGKYVHEVLELNINGMIHAFAHHGKERGKGENEGNALRNFLRDTRNDRDKEGLSRLDCLWSGHTHGHTWVTHIKREGSSFHEFHGVICPSWQAKTRYALGKVPMVINSVGGTYARITVDGDMQRPRFVVQTTRDK